MVETCLSGLQVHSNGYYIWRLDFPKYKDTGYAPSLELLTDFTDTDIYFPINYDINKLWYKIIPRNCTFIVASHKGFNYQSFAYTLKSFCFYGGDFQESNSIPPGLTHSTMSKHACFKGPGCYCTQIFMGTHRDTYCDTLRTWILKLHYLGTKITVSAENIVPI